MGERDELLFFINRLRDSVVRVVEGVDEEQVRSPGVPSGTNLIGLVWHLQAMEVKWLQEVVAGLSGGVDSSLNAPESLDSAAVVAAYRAACTESNRIVLACSDLSTPSAGIARLPVSDDPDDPANQRRHVTVREALVHLIEETARHAGHADILREQIDGATDL